MKYKVGSVIKINPSNSYLLGYTNELLTVIGYGINAYKEEIYLVNKKICKGDGVPNGLYPGYVIQDSECFRKERLRKLKRLRNEI